MHPVAVAPSTAPDGWWPELPDTGMGASRRSDWTGRSRVQGAHVDDPAPARPPHLRRRPVRPAVTAPARDDRATEPSGTSRDDDGSGGPTAAGDGGGTRRSSIHRAGFHRAQRFGWVSASVHLVGDVTAHAGVATVVTVAVAAFLVALARAGYPESWEAGFATVAAAITLVMVFVIQHTQNRQQLATQLKLDELIRAHRAGRRPPGARRVGRRVRAGRDRAEPARPPHHRAQRRPMTAQDRSVTPATTSMPMPMPMMPRSAR